MADQDDHRGSAARSWWIDALDPVENLRVLADAQKYGRRAAEDLADRLLPGNGRDGPDDDVSETIERLRADALRAGELSVSMIDHLTTLLGAVARGRSPDRKPASVVLPDVVPGGEAYGIFWVHNTAAVPVAGVRPHALAPRSHLGDELPPGAVCFDPVLLDPLPARSSCGIEVHVSVPATARPGIYVSVILVENVPEMSLALRVTVRAEEDIP